MCPAQGEAHARGQASGLGGVRGPGEACARAGEREEGERENEEKKKREKEIGNGKRKKKRKKMRERWRRFRRGLRRCWARVLRRPVGRRMRSEEKKGDGTAVGFGCRVRKRFRGNRAWTGRIELNDE